MGGEQIPVGFVIRAHGVRGDVLVKPLTDNPDRFVCGAEFTTPSAPGTVTLTEVRPHKAGLILSLAEVPDRTAAERLAKTTLTIDAAQRRDLEADEFWPEDLVGLDAVDTQGTQLGVVVDVVIGVAQDRLVIETPDGRSVEVPFVADLVDEPDADVVVLRPPQGLFEPE